MTVVSLLLYLTTHYIRNGTGDGKVDYSDGSIYGTSVIKFSHPLLDEPRIGFCPMLWVPNL